VTQPGIEFDWDEANISHLGRHRVQPEEAEQVILSNPVDLATEIVEGEERYLNLGATQQGRILLVVDHVARRPRTRSDGVRTNQAVDSVLLPGTREVIRHGHKPTTLQV
jgi:uncharacterized DUF497 family protein